MARAIRREREKDQRHLGNCTPGKAISSSPNMVLKIEVNYKNDALLHVWLTKDLKQNRETNKNKQTT